MPQGRKKIPFSGKAKKLQLQEKKLRKGAQSNVMLKGYNGGEDDKTEKKVLRINQQPRTTGGRNKNDRYALQFYSESNEEIRKLKEAARLSLNPVSEKQLEIAIEDYFPSEIDFPKRPPWNFEMSREQLDLQEHRYFTKYVTVLQEKFVPGLSYFELNVETWRQLWRVLEMSDIILIIVDIRFPALMFPPSLYSYVTEVLKKDMIIVLNKVDLAPAPLVVAWKCYFEKKFPDLHVLLFTSYPSYNLRGSQNTKAGLKVRRRRGKLRMAAEGTKKLLDACREIVKDEVDLDSWHNKIMEEMELEYENDEVEIEETIELRKIDTSYVKLEKYQGGVLTIGCVGQPNVGKSSLMNAIMGKKVVSVSRTPGHTKHFQTIYLTPHVRLCDCPGLVFPSKVPKTLQILMGSFPIAQVREPFSAVRFLAERVSLPHLLSLQHPEGDDEWSALDICDAWAQKRGFYTARAARLDSHRAANHLLRMALEGKICICLYPPEFANSKGHWETHADLELVHWIQATTINDEQSEEAQCCPSFSDEEVASETQEYDAEVTGEDGDDREENLQSDDENIGLYGNKFSLLSTDD